MERLKNKVAIITGGARGMGASHVRLFVKEGAKVVFTDLNEEAGRILEKEVGSNAKFIKHDVTDLEGWNKVVNETEEIFGPVNILVNNAGIAANKSILEMTEGEYRKIVDINQVSVFLGIKSVISSMKKVDNASIINISSMNGIIGGAIGYTDTKFAVR